MKNNNQLLKLSMGSSCSCVDQQRDYKNGEVSFQHVEDPTSSRSNNSSHLKNTGGKTNSNVENPEKGTQEFDSIVNEVPNIPAPCSQKATEESNIVSKSALVDYVKSHHSESLKEYSYQISVNKSQGLKREIPFYRFTANYQVSQSQMMPRPREVDNLPAKNTA